jgi:hypothetical protein
MASVAFPELSKTLTVKDGTKYGYIKVEPKGNNPTLLFLHGVSIPLKDLPPLSFLFPTLPNTCSQSPSIHHQATSGTTK